MEAGRPTRVLVVEDDQDIAEALQRSLRMEGYEVRMAFDGVAALDEARAFVPDLLILDLGLPRLDGTEVARRLREAGEEVPILILTARDALDSRVEGLDLGADDYLVKPFERQELLARLRALLRRRPPRGMAPLRVGDLLLNPRRVLSHSVIYDRVWGYDFGPTSNALRVYVGYLRRKLESAGSRPLIHTIRGVGYALREP